MAQRIILDCDNCGHEGAETIGPIDLGGGPRLIDLDEPCQVALHIPEIIAILTERGVRVDQGAPVGAVDGRSARVTATAKGASIEPRQCPVEGCVEIVGTRGAMINHVASKHNVNKIQASHIVKPYSGSPGEECPVCHLLCDEGMGIKVHMRTKHKDQLAA